MADLFKLDQPVSLHLLLHGDMDRERKREDDREELRNTSWCY
jgi:hypothetical protein